MYCTECGTDNRDSAKFCEQCGSSFTEASDLSLGEKNDNNPVVSEKSMSKQQCISCKGRGKVFSWKFIFSLFIGLFIVPVVGLYFGTIYAAPVAMLAVIHWGWKSRRCKVCGGSGIMVMQ